MLTETGDTLPVDLRTLEGPAVMQMFHGSEIRDEGQQRAWLESQKRKADSSLPVDDLPYRVVGGDLVVTSPTCFSKKELQRILMGM